MWPTSEGAEAAAASSCRVVAVAVRIVGSLVGPCRRVQPASSSSIAGDSAWLVPISDNVITSDILE